MNSTYPKPEKGRPLKKVWRLSGLKCDVKIREFEITLLNLRLRLKYPKGKITLVKRVTSKEGEKIELYSAPEKVRPLKKGEG